MNCLSLLIGSKGGGLIKVISFMFPVTSKIDGGVQSLVVALVNELVLFNDVKVRLYDYSFGLVYNKLTPKVREGIEFVSLDLSGWCINNLGDETFVLTDFLWLKYPYFFKNTNGVRLLMLDVYYPNWRRFYRAKNIIIPFVKKEAVRVLSEKKAVIFIEDKGLKEFEAIGGYGCKDDCVVPIPFKVGDSQGLTKAFDLNNSKRKVVFGYISRAVRWKVMPVIKLIEDLVAANINFKLVVYTNSRLDFKEILCERIAMSEYDIDFIEGASGAKLKESIVSNIDIGYAMGTASLEFAALKVPALLADFSEKYFPDEYKYRWLYEADKGNVGLDLVDISSFGERHSIADVLASDLSRASTLSYEYVKANHDSTFVAKKVVRAAERTTMTTRDIKALVFYPYFLTYLIKRVVRQNKKFFGWGIK